MVMPKASWFGAQENSGKPAFGGREQSGTPAAVERTEGQGKLLLFAGLEGPGTDTEIKGKSSQKRPERKQGDNGEVELTKEIGDVGDQERKAGGRRAHPSQSQSWPSEHRAKGSDQGLQTSRPGALQPALLSWCACVPSRFSCVRLFATPWTVAFQAPLSMEFSWQEYWSGLLFPPPGDLHDPRIILPNCTSFTPILLISG